jgi:hypothetical protein
MRPGGGSGVAEVMTTVYDSKVSTAAWKWTSKLPPTARGS